MTTAREIDTDDAFALIWPTQFAVGRNVGSIVTFAGTESVSELVLSGSPKKLVTFSGVIGEPSSAGCVGIT